MTTMEKLEELIYKGFKETDHKFRETDRKLKELIKQSAGLNDSLGRFAENMVKPAVERLFAKRGIVLTDFYHRASSRLNGSTMEMDIIGAGPQHVIAVEVKLRLKQPEVDAHLEKLPRFFDFFERYRGLILHGAVAGMSVDQGIDRYAYQCGLFVLTQSGENVRLLNDEKFIPRAYTYSAK